MALVDRGDVAADAVQPAFGEGHQGSLAPHGFT